MRARTVSSAFFLLVACGSDPPDPGFQVVSGGSSGTGAAGAEGGGGGTPSSNGPGPGPGPSNTTTSAQGGDDTGGAGAGGSPDGGGGSGQGGGLGCPVADDEPNDTESTAVDLGVITDCDGDGSSFSGVVAGLDDEDWFKYQASDDFGCSVDATRDVMAGQAVRFCKYAQCTDGSEASFSCPGGATAATSPDGRPGCCANAGFSFAPDCESISDDAIIYMHVRTMMNVCASYSVDYHY